MSERYIPDGSRFTARFVVSDELLERLLLLPEGVRVRMLTYSHQNAAYEFSVEGGKDSGLPMVAPGGIVPAVTPKYRHVDGRAEFEGW